MNLQTQHKSNGIVATPRFISIVVPVYQNETNLEETILTFIHLRKKLPNYDLELVFVDDGSTDRSYQILEDFRKLHPETIRIVKLVRNFGQIPALQAGLKVARGDCVAMISADLQDPPELIIDMVAHWERGIKLVIAERKGRKDSFLRDFISTLYWGLVRKLAIRNYPSGGFDYCLVDREIINVVNQIDEKNTHIFVLIFSLGYSYHTLTYQRKRRTKGKSQWTLSKKINLSIDILVNFSYLPLRIISYLGLIVSLLSFVYIIYVFFFWAIKGNPYQGWTTMTMLIGFLGGLILLTLGIIGEYLWRILDAVRRRPNFLIEKISESSSHGTKTILSDQRDRQ
uniref:Dolichol-phosphate mannosyltransferase n=1 Tax=Candidatus Kentrum sp. FW TaxID=2126338 RepID=A0A450TCR8_9GAMM|nr:MAG: dolichol-phosphate mannosyltransferase [Candidatus Kentron sp. FW]